MYAARLLRLRKPDWSVVVHERHPRGSTFGFGIGLSPATLRRMRAADQATYAGLLEIGHELHTWRMRIGEREISGGDNQSIGLSRPAMLEVLAAHAIAAGVEVTWGGFTQLADVADADLVIAADGAGSAARTVLSDQLGVTVEPGGLGYIWCGADIDADAMRFEVLETEYGVFTAHVMPFAEGKSTFQVDAQHDTIRRAGLADAIADVDGSDSRSIDFLSGLYERLLEGTRLRGNGSNWSTFNAVRCHRWSHDNVVLIGDAAHTAHYTVGSGTRMAMEDALALVESVCSEPNIRSALDNYERTRRPIADRLQDRAVRSQEWWMTLPNRINLPMPQLMANYQTRTGAVGAAGLAAADPTLVAAALELLGDAPEEGTDGDEPASILSRPFVIARRTLPSRMIDLSGDTLVVSADPREVADYRASHPTATILATVDEGVTVELTRNLREAGADALNFEAARFDDILLCLDAAERARLMDELPVAATACRAQLDMMAAGVLGGRIDLVSLVEGADA
jgi:anthraniloyl-CoA monooxygenase